MFARLLISAAVASLFAFPALAADSSTNTAATPNATQTTQNLPAEIRSKLEQDGFTDVNVVPGSFLVSAKDKSGDPVTMIIGPNSMMMLTQVPTASSTTGSGVKSDRSSSDKSDCK